MELSGFSLREILIYDLNVGYQRKRETLIQNPSLCYFY